MFSNKYDRAHIQEYRAYLSVCFDKTILYCISSGVETGCKQRKEAFKRAILHTHFYQ